MSELFHGLDRLDLRGQVLRWSALEPEGAGGEMNEWLAAAQQFAARLQEDAVRVPEEEWPEVARAWGQLLEGARQATGEQRNEWLLRDLWLRASLVRTAGPRLDRPLHDPGEVVERALAAMPMSLREAASRAPRWRELEREQILSLRMIRRLLGPVTFLGGLPAEHPRRDECRMWERLLPDLP
ncbi:hypothetical protein IAG44_12045 [Streptomyces roseirectus]|uniref:Uncharacterized protein n=1 Tax=Streptomyces roseirectus TaxID=2768066 RepID=A0A7H0IBE3_9ACTN|nr:hypothetical protein [Streptomyces roseirectus]QNP70109.1 hypothetical protein IAG44_12045 [Streptomyces roseirectus]